MKYFAFYYGLTKESLKKMIRNVVREEIELVAAFFTAPRRKSINSRIIAVGKKLKRRRNLASVKRNVKSVFTLGRLSFEGTAVGVVPLYNLESHETVKYLKIVLSKKVTLYVFVGIPVELSQRVIKEKA